MIYYLILEYYNALVLSIMLWLDSGIVHSEGLTFQLLEGICYLQEDDRKENAMKAGVTIGELAKEIHLNPKTIRYYEEIGLLSKPRRSESGYRLYSRYEIERLQLVKRAKLLGLSLAEIKELVDYAIDWRCNALEQRLFSLVVSNSNQPPSWYL